MSKYEVWLATHAAGISGNARVLLAHYIQHSWFDAAHRPKGSNAPRGVSYWSKSALAKCLNMTPKTIYNANQALTDAGFISVTNRYREGDKGSGGRTSNAVRVHLEAIEAHQIESTNDAASYPQPQVKNTSNPQVKNTSKGSTPGKNLPGGLGKNYPIPQVKITCHKDSNKKIVNKKKKAGGSERPLDQPHALPAATAAERLEAAAGIVTGLAHDRNPSDLPRLQAALASIYGWEAAQGLTLEAIPARCITMGKARAWVQSFDSLQLNTAAGEPSPDTDSSTSRRHQPASICTDPASRSGRPALHPGDALPAPVAPGADMAEANPGDSQDAATAHELPTDTPPATSTTQHATADPAPGAKSYHQPTTTVGDSYEPVEPIPGQIDVYEALDEIALHPAA